MYNNPKMVLFLFFNCILNFADVGKLIVWNLDKIVRILIFSRN